MRLAIVQRGDTPQFLATRLDEQFLVLHGDFLQRFQKIDGETGADDKPIACRDLPTADMFV